MYAGNKDILSEVSRPVGKEGLSGFAQIPPKDFIHRLAIHFSTLLFVSGPLASVQSEVRNDIALTVTVSIDLFETIGKLQVEFG